MLKSGRIPVLDGVRGVAALIVLVSHSANLGWIPVFLGRGAGKMGVALFFILSGFLMTWLYAHRPIGCITDYARNRFARIVPLYLGLVLLSIVFPSALFPIDTPAKIAEHLGFVFGVQTLWTIPVEVQFYFLFVLIWLSPRKAFPLLIAGEAVLTAMLHLLHAPSTTLPFWLHFFLIGSAAGFIWRRYCDRLKEVAPRYSALGWPIIAFALLATPGLRVSAGFPSIPQYLDPIMGGAAVLLFTGALLGLRPLNALEAPFARWLGKISYGVYLIHYPLLQALDRLALPGVVRFALGTATTLCLASLSFKFFEEPLRQKLSSDRKQPFRLRTRVKVVS